MYDVKAELAKRLMSPREAMEQLYQRARREEESEEDPTIRALYGIRVANWEQAHMIRLFINYVRCPVWILTLWVIGTDILKWLSV